MDSEFSQSDIQALKIRFNESYTDGTLLLHCLPNNLCVYTFHPKFINGKKKIEMVNCSFGKTISTDVFCVVDGEEIINPIPGTIVDINENLDSQVERFAAGPTAAFTIILKPCIKVHQDISDTFHKLW